MANFQDLQDRVKTYLIDVPTSISTLAPSLVNEALTKLQAKHNFKVMKAEFLINTQTAQRILAPIPENFKEFRERPYYVEELGLTRWVNIAPNEAAAEAYRSTTDDGSPQFILEGLLNEDGSGNWEIYPLPDTNSDYTDGEYRLVIPYWKYLQRLSANSDQNWFTNFDPAIEWIVASATAEGFAINEDEDRAQYWEGKAQKKWDDVLLISKRQALAGFDTLVPYTGARSPRVSR